MNSNSFGDYIKNARLEKKLSLRVAAEMLNISHSYLNKLEKGFDIRNNNQARPTPEVIETLSKFYKLDYNHLMKLCGYLKDTEDVQEKDISKLLEKTLDEMSEIEGLMFHGEPVDYNDYLKIKSAIEVGVAVIMNQRGK